VAAPITHIVLAEKIFDKYFADKDKKEFFVGTSFPDIRYLGVIDRSKTHFEVISFPDVVEDDPFLCGVKFHSLVDKVREDFMKSSGFYNLFPGSQFLTQAVKVFEDRVLYKKISSWKLIINFFDEVDKNETAFGIEDKDVERWHVLLRHYFSQPPITDEVIKVFIKDMGRPDEMAEEMIRVLAGVGDKDKATDIVNDFYLHFEDLLQKH
jgi:hypothetical protein